MAYSCSFSRISQFSKYSIFFLIIGISTVIYWLYLWCCLKYYAPFTRTIVPLEVKIMRNVSIFEEITKTKIKGYSTGIQNNKTTSSIDKNSFTHCHKFTETFEPFKLNETYDIKILRRHPNLPLFLTSARKLSKLIPPIYSIRWSGTVYQESWIEHPKCFLYSANFDARLPDGLVVRILALCEGMGLALGSYCQFWFNETHYPVTSPIYKSSFAGRHNGGGTELKINMISCKVPIRNGEKGYPIAVSIVKKPCTRAANVLTIDGSPIPRKENDSSNKNLTVGICGKALYYYKYDFSIRLIEWVEILKILGVSKFFLYESYVHKNVRKVMDYYERKGTFRIVSFHYPSPIVQDNMFFRLWTESPTNYKQFMSAQRVFYTDCLLRNKDWFDFLGVFDYDEIPILKKHRNLQEFLKLIKEKYTNARNASSVCLNWKLHHAQFEPSGPAVSFPKELFILRHNVRTPLHIRLGAEGPPKSIHDTRRSLYIGVHTSEHFQPIPPLNPSKVYINKKLAYTAHFRDRPCDSNCLRKRPEEENRLLEYKSEVLKQMNIVRKKIEL